MCIKFKPVKKNITYEDVADDLFCNNGLFIGIYGEIECFEERDGEKYNKNNAKTKRQLDKVLALNQLLNIAEYYNKQYDRQDYRLYYIAFEKKS